MPCQPEKSSAYEDTQERNDVDGITNPGSTIAEARAIRESVFSSLHPKYPRGRT